MSMTQRQRESAAKYLYDFSKGIGLIAVVGGLVGELATETTAMIGSRKTLRAFPILHGRGLKTFDCSTSPSGIPDERFHYPQVCGVPDRSNVFGGVIALSTMTRFCRYYLVLGEYDPNGTPNSGDELYDGGTNRHAGLGRYCPRASEDLHQVEIAAPLIAECSGLYCTPVPSFGDSYRSSSHPSVPKHVV